MPRLAPALAALSFLLAPADAPSAAPAPPARPPSFLVIQADDLGWGDLRFHGNRWVETDHLDQLARESINFRQFYVHSVCAPTRASFLTGRHFLRTGVSGVHGGRDFLNLNEVTVAEHLREAGYRTAMFGKWHSGKTDGYFPWDRGFETAYMAELYRQENARGWLNGELVTPTEWGDDHAASLAIEWLGERSPTEPFFLYYAPMAPHEPWEAPEHQIAKYRAKGLSPNASVLYGMIDQLDDNIGRVLAALEASGRAQDTVVLFMSDNGPWTTCSRHGALSEEDWAMRNPLPLRGNKGTNWENGIRSPLLVRWPVHVRPEFRDELLSVEDIGPTLLDLAGVVPSAAAPPMDGVSFAPLLSGGEVAWSRPPVFIAQWNPELDADKNEMDPWLHHVPLSPRVKASIDFATQRIGLRDTRHKLLWNQYGDLSIDQVELRDMFTDPLERVNVYPEQADVAARLRGELEEWFADILSDPGSYTMPVFLVGHRGHSESEILAYGPSDVDDGLVNTAYALRNWTTPGQWATWDIDVRTPGKHQVALWRDGQVDATPTVRVRVGEAHADGKVHGKSTELGVVDLAAGRAALRLELLDPGEGPAPAIDKLEKIVLRRVE